MKLETAEYVRHAADLGYLFPEIAGRLLEAKAHERGARLERVSRALEFFEPDRPHVPEPAWSFVRAVAQLVVALLYASDREARTHYAPLLRRLLAEASRIRRAEESTAAAERASLREAATWEAREAEARHWREKVEASV